MSRQSLHPYIQQLWLVVMNEVVHLTWDIECFNPNPNIIVIVHHVMPGPMLWQAHRDSSKLMDKLIDAQTLKPFLAVTM